MTTLNPAQSDMLALLRGSGQDRPGFNEDLRTELQTELDQALDDIDVQISVDKRRLAHIHQCEGRYSAPEVFEWSPRVARGTIAHKAIELAMGGQRSITPARLVELATGRIYESPEHSSLADYLRAADDGERAEIRVGAIDLVMKHRELFPPIPESWLPNAEATTAAWAAKRKVLLRGKLDLKLGEARGNRAGSLLIDFKTGSPSFTDLEDLRFYALIETLRTGVPPFRWANVYLDAGRAEFEDATVGALRAAARRVTDGVRKMAELHHGRVPRLTPGLACRFCPLEQCAVRATGEL